ncbi:MAG: hypothetical protein M1840_006211 [Geoglossum simile]|nr:MAG: hypothetical protein M1840_006211 [Geoglossum simile]
MANTTPITFAPAFPIPLVFDVQERIEQLRSYLDPSNPLYQPEPQHINIKAAITLYEDGKLDGLQQVYIMDGKVVSWEVVMRHQYAQKYVYGHGPFGPMNHELRMLLRLIPDLGGDGTVHGIIAMNDTGSDILTIFDADVPFLGNFQGYAGWDGIVTVGGAGGIVGVFPKLRVQVQLVGDDNLPWSDWINGEAIIRPVGPGIPRLSGYRIREGLYFATGPGNHTLAVSTTKAG